jgi:hypothetical protein
MSRKRLLPFAFCLILSFALPISLSAQTPLGTSVFAVPYDFSACKDRVSKALDAEGFGRREDFGNGWQAYKATASTSIGCIHGTTGSIVMMVVSGTDNAGARIRLMDLIWNNRTTPDPGSTYTGPLPINAGNPKSIAWTDKADKVRAGPPPYNQGVRLLVSCAGRNEFEGGNVWGTGSYSMDSAVCKAAVHTGVITLRQGGPFVIEFSDAVISFSGSTQNPGTPNEVRSSGAGAEPGSFKVFAPPPTTTTFDIDRPRPPAPAPSTPAPAPLTGGRRIDWFTKGDQLRDGAVPNENSNQPKYKNGDRVLVSCQGQPFMPGGGLWGSGPFTIDSTICLSAIHAGVSTLQQGGTFYVEFMVDAGFYAGSDQNGIRAQQLGRAFPAGAFRVSR